MNDKAKSYIAYFSLIFVLCLSTFLFSAISPWRRNGACHEFFNPLHWDDRHLFATAGLLAPFNWRLFGTAIFLRKFPVSLGEKNSKFHKIQDKIKHP